MLAANRLSVLMDYLSCTEQTEKVMTTAEVLRGGSCYPGSGECEELHHEVRIPLTNHQDYDLNQARKLSGEIPKHLVSVGSNQ
jgi:hypothetical protein